MGMALLQKRKLPRKSKQWDKEIHEVLEAARQLSKERYFGTFVSPDDPSSLARDRDGFTALGIMEAFMLRDISNKDLMLRVRSTVYRHIFDEMRQDVINHPGEMFVSAYLYTHVALNILSAKKYGEIIEQFSRQYGEQLGWHSNDYADDCASGD
jgi:hypothetical protein